MFFCRSGVDKPEGVVIALLECPHIQEPADFSDWFAIRSLARRERMLRGQFTVPGYVALKNGLDAARIPQIIVTLPQNRAFIEQAGMSAVTTFAEALALAEGRLGRKDYTITVMPDVADSFRFWTARATAINQVWEGNVCIGINRWRL